MNVRNELFFPPELIGDLGDLRDGDWATLVGQIAPLPDTHPDALAFALMVIKLSGCLSCGPGSFRHMKGCLSCSRQALSAYKGGHKQLADMFEESRQEVLKFLDEGKKAKIAA